ncbi:MAG: DUF1638 domain-containing protein [Bacillota bacterium]|jgi:hypothetical protein
MNKYMMVACRNIEDEIDAVMRENNLDYPVVYLQSGLHDLPKKLHDTLQALIDSLTDIEYLLLPMGRCGNSTLGLRSERFSLVLPKCEDCINLLLSDDDLKAERPKGRMFFTQGWLRSVRAAPNEYDDCVRKYGKESADMIMQSMYSGYSHFAILNTGLFDIEKAMRILSPVAKAASVDFEELEAPYGVLKRMLKLELDSDNFVIVPPGTEVTEEMLALE